MANYLVFDKENGKILQWLPSIDGAEYRERNDVLIHPDLPEGVPLDDCLVEDSVVREMTAQEKKDRDDVIALKIKLNKKAKIEKFQVTAKDLAEVLVNLGVVTAGQLKQEIKRLHGIED